MVVNHQVHADGFAQLGRGGAEAERLDRGAVEAGDALRVVGNAVVDQRDLGRFGVVAEQLQIDVGQARGGAVPHRAGDVRAKFGQPLHPNQRQAAQRGQLGRLRVAVKQLDVGAHLGLHQIVVWQGGARRRAQAFLRAALGRTVVQPFFDHQARGVRGDLVRQGFHARILPCPRQSLKVNAKPARAHRAGAARMPRTTPPDSPWPQLGCAHAGLARQAVRRSCPWSKRPLAQTQTALEAIILRVKGAGVFTHRAAGRRACSRTGARHG